MNDMETDRLIQVVDLLFREVPEVENHKLQTKVWSAVLRDVSYTEAETALIEIARSGAPHPPAVGEVLAMVLRLREEASGERSPDADEALGIVLAAVRKRGYSQGPPESWPHPAIAAVVSALSWREICLSTNQEALRAHFFRLYDGARRRVDTQARRSPQARELISGMRQGLAPGAIGELDRPAD